MTCSSKGSAIIDGDEYWEVEATPVKAVDTIGAGDGYLAAVAANLVWGKSLRESTEWASKYAAYKSDTSWKYDKEARVWISEQRRSRTIYRFNQIKKEDMGMYCEKGGRILFHSANIPSLSPERMKV